MVLNNLQNRLLANLDVLGTIQRQVQEQCNNTQSKPQKNISSVYNNTVPSNASRPLPDPKTKKKQKKPPKSRCSITTLIRLC